jgi:WD40 repeat protein
MRSWSVAHTLTGHTSSCTSVAFDDRLIVTGSNDHLCKVWYVLVLCCLSLCYRSRCKVRILRPCGMQGRAQVSRACHTPRRKIVCVLGCSQQCGIACLPRSLLPRLVLRSCVGGVIAAGGHDGILRLWDRVNFRTLRELTEHTGSVIFFALVHSFCCSYAMRSNRYIYTLNADNLRIATGGEDSVVRLWDFTSIGSDAVAAVHDTAVTQPSVCDALLCFWDLCVERF